MLDRAALEALTYEALCLAAFYEAAREVLRMKCERAGGDPAILDTLMDTHL